MHIKIDDISELYRSYNESVKPLLIEIELLFQKFPLSILNEIRAFNDHISRCFYDTSDKNDVKKEIERAKRHLYRIILDEFKYLNIYYYESCKKYEKSWKHFNIDVLNDGKFYSEYECLKKNALQNIRSAKIEESKNKDLSLKLYAQAYENYLAIDSLILKNDVAISRAKVKFAFNKGLKIILWFLSILISVFITYVLSTKLEDRF